LEHLIIKGFRHKRNPFFLSGPLSVPFSPMRSPKQALSGCQVWKNLGHEIKVMTEIYAGLALDPVRESVERATEEMLRAKKG
jgi:hypothetical protein